MSFDLIVRGGTVVLPDTNGVAADIAIKDERIAAILAPGTAADARETLDVSGKTVLPGVIDVHLHLGHGKDIARPRVPEDAATETAAAALGGITTFIPYLMATEPFETIFDEVRGVTEAGARIDFGYHFIISTEEQLAGVPRYAREFGAPSFKIFMNNRGGEGARLGLPDIDDGFLLRLCEAAAANGGMVCPHPENIEAAWVLRKREMEMPTPRDTAACAPGMQRDRHSSRPMPCNVPGSSRARQVRGSTSCTHRRARRWRQDCVRVMQARTSSSKPVRII